MKNPSHPNQVARNPVVEPAKTRGIPMKLVNKAYWVAVNRLLVRLAIYATNAVCPSPLEMVSKAITAVRVGR